MLANTQPRLINLELTEPNPPRKGHENLYALFKSLPDICVDSTTMPPITITNINSINNSNIQKESVKDTELHLLLSAEKLIDMENNDM